MERGRERREGSRREGMREEGVRGRRSEGYWIKKFLDLKRKDQLDRILTETDHYLKTHQIPENSCRDELNSFFSDRNKIFKEADKVQIKKKKRREGGRREEGGREGGSEIEMT